MSAAAIAVDNGADERTAETLAHEAAELAALPFLGFVQTDDGPVRCYWKVPGTGGYTGGNMVGRAAAGLFLRSLRTPDAFSDQRLSWILLAMAEALSSASKAEDGARHGQVVGFACELSRFIIRSLAGPAGRIVDERSERDLRDLFLAGCHFDEAAYWATLTAGLAPEDIPPDEDEEGAPAAACAGRGEAEAAGDEGKV